jgi:hypothetical protein
LKCAICEKDFACSRNSPICSTEESRGFSKYFGSKHRNVYVRGKWVESFIYNLSKVVYSNLVPDDNYKVCICYECYIHNFEFSASQVSKLFKKNIDVELLHFFFGASENPEDLTNIIFPPSVPIVLICYGKETITLDRL